MIKDLIGAIQKAESDAARLIDEAHAEAQEITAEASVRLASESAALSARLSARLGEIEATEKLEIQKRLSSLKSSTKLPEDIDKRKRRAEEAIIAAFNRKYGS